MNQINIPFVAVHNKGLEINNISKTYNKKKVVNNVSIKLNRGESVALLGPNGAGKTTLFYMIMGLIGSDTGSILLDKNEISEFPMYRRSKLGIGYLPQESSVFRGLSVAQNIKSVLEIVESDKDVRDGMLEELMAEFSIAHLRNTAAINLSGGERRRLEIARALAAKPTFLLLDEPLAGIDPIAVGEVRDLITHLKESGLGVLITDHNVRETLGICDRGYIVNEGKSIAYGTPHQILENREVKKVYLGEDFRM